MFIGQLALILAEINGIYLVIQVVIRPTSE